MTLVVDGVSGREYPQRGRAKTSRITSATGFVLALAVIAKTLR